MSEDKIGQKSGKLCIGWYEKASIDTRKSKDLEEYEDLCKSCYDSLKKAIDKAKNEIEKKTSQ